MDDLGAAISGFLSQPGAMEQLEAAAKQLGLGPAGGGEPPPREDTEQLSPEKLQKLMQAVSAGSQPDQATALLDALRPMLRPEKQGKLDRAIRALRLMRTARTVTETIEL